ncbi:ABC transporter permease subunit [Halapricum sp. CBA1109]|uniref:ABC transporter permease n=1 Tax=Halapricum sp. CBA1109 TaxID=2668068 RepID=UPI0012F9902C|nr:ABC transporter permease [Halapricum sp. CBA1109]MUV90446.1 ABC transporter permease subunit [Halapricum sp. CBA1109]
MIPFLRRVARRLGTIAAPFLVFGVCWELASGPILDARFFPPPSAVLSLAVELYLEEGFLTHVLASLQRILLATALGATSGVVVGLVAGWSRKVGWVLNPHLALLYPVPKVALLPVLFVVLGGTEMVRVLTMSLAVFLLVAIDTMGGVREIDDVHVEVALDNGAGPLALYREVILPGTLPQVFSAVSMGFSVGFALLVVIEMLAAESGLGYVIWNSWQLFTIPRMYVAVLTINVLGVVFVHGTEMLGDVLTPWEHGQRR